MQKDMTKKSTNASTKKINKYQLTADEKVKAEKKLRESIKEIRNELKDCVIVFIDMVDSSKFKTQNSSKPEIWISRIQQFSEIVSSYVKSCNGKVVKYIGDEVMAVFDQTSMIIDAINLLNRISELEKDLTTVSKAETRVKVVADYGKVYFIKYEGHDELDPQGTCVDRCKRISKFSIPGVILTSVELVKKYY